MKAYYSRALEIMKNEGVIPLIKSGVRKVIKYFHVKNNQKLPEMLTKSRQR